MFFFPPSRLCERHYLEILSRKAVKNAKTYLWDKTTNNVTRNFHTTRLHPILPPCTADFAVSAVRALPPRALFPLCRRTRRASTLFPPPCTAVQRCERRDNSSTACAISAVPPYPPRLRERHYREILSRKAVKNAKTYLWDKTTNNVTRYFHTTRLHPILPPCTAVVRRARRENSSFAPWRLCVSFFSIFKFSYSIERYALFSYNASTLFFRRVPLCTAVSAVRALPPRALFPPCRRTLRPPRPCLTTCTVVR